MTGFFDASAKDVARLILVRHGQTASNQEGRILGTKDEPLDATGLAQAERVARRLAELPVAAIYSSPLSRARATATMAAQRLRLEVEVDPDLVEYDFGVLSDLTLPELSVRDPALFARVQAWISMGAEETLPRPEIPGAESMDSLAARARWFMARIVAQHQGKVAVAVAHGGVIRAILALCAGGSLEHRIAFRPDNASLSVVDFYRGVPCIRGFNDVSHLGGVLTYGRPTVL